MGFSRRCRAGLYYSFSILSLVLISIGLVSASTAPWGMFVAKSKSYRLGLWSQYACDGAGVCTSGGFGDPLPPTVATACTSAGTQAAICLISALVIYAVLFANSLSRCCSPEQGDSKWMRGILVVKTLVALSMPIVAMIVWIQKCYNPAMKSANIVNLTWGFGLGIVIAPIVIEAILILLFPAIWKTNDLQGTKQEKSSLLGKEKKAPEPPKKDLEKGKSIFGRKK
jgi:uncharacterized membrane protein YhdT